MLIVTLPEGFEVQPEALATVKVYVPGDNEGIVKLVPDPVVVTFPGNLVNVHEPGEGRPLRVILPVLMKQSGWVMGPMTGAEGVAGWVLMVTAEPGDVHPEAFLAVTV